MNDGVEKKLYRLTKPGAVEDVSQQTFRTMQESHIGNVFPLFDVGTYAEVENDDLVHQGKIMIADDQRFRLESMVADYGLGRPRGQEALRVLLSEQEMSVPSLSLGLTG